MRLPSLVRVAAIDELTELEDVIALGECPLDPGGQMVVAPSASL